MATMLAWPWNMTLSAVEASRIASAQEGATIKARWPAGQPRQIGRLAKAAQLASVTPSADFEEEEGNDANPTQTTSGCSPLASAFSSPSHFVAAPTPLGSRSSPAIAALCRLRC